MPRSESPPIIKYVAPIQDIILNRQPKMLKARPKNFNLSIIKYCYESEQDSEKWISACFLLLMFVRIFGVYLSQP